MAGGVAPTLTAAAGERGRGFHPRRHGNSLGTFKRFLLLRGGGGSGCRMPPPLWPDSSTMLPLPRPRPSSFLPCRLLPSNPPPRVLPQFTSVHTLLPAQYAPPPRSPPSPPLAPSPLHSPFPPSWQPPPDSPCHCVVVLPSCLEGRRCSSDGALLTQSDTATTTMQWTTGRM